MSFKRRVDALETKHNAARKVDWGRDIAPTLARQSARAVAILAERLNMPIDDDIIAALQDETPEQYTHDLDLHNRWMVQQGLNPEQVACDNRAKLTTRLDAIIERRNINERMESQ